MYLEPEFPTLPTDQDLPIAENLSSETELEGITIATEKREGRQRQLSATIHIPAPHEQVWSIITDYNHLADFIPNLAKSQQIPHPQGGIRLEQVGSQSFLKFKFCARVVLDMIEHAPTQLDFRMVEGDFKEFYGSWTLQPHTMNGGWGTQLHYRAIILPPRTMPVSMIERCLSHSLTLNLQAIRQRAAVLGL